MIERAVELRDVFCVHRTSEGDAAALQGATLDLFTEEVLCVLGPSGAGKSTLLRVIAGLQVPSAGVVNVLGHDMSRMPGYGRARLRHEELGFLGQRAENALPPDLPAREAVALPLALRGLSKRARSSRVEKLIEAAGLTDRAHARPDELSGGERQRFALCAALAHRPALLLADEPTGELDPAGAEAMRELIATLARATGTSVLVVSHDPAMSSIADRTLAIRDGRVAEELGESENLLVVGQGGWVRLPAELLDQAGIARRAAIRTGTEGLIVTPAPVLEKDVAGLSGPPATTRRRSGWTPARAELRSVSRGYGRGRGFRQVLDSVSHEFAPGSLTVITGPSGMGKTTSLRLLAGLDRPDRGVVVIDGEPLGGASVEQLAALRRRRIGYLPQEPAPVGFLSAAENVALVLRARGWDGRAAAERAEAVLWRVGLRERARQRVGRLSAGEAQRVALARALASARGLLIVDEPTSRLDEANALTVAELLAVAAQKDGQTVICASHDPAVIRKADEVLELGG